ncbi:MAG: hypothetical protein JNM72_00360 [Deltaproteobacteria bacterium]|nr:hypothetical protein [Deltaproteobacteria bacterium]
MSVQSERTTTRPSITAVRGAARARGQLIALLGASASMGVGCQQPTDPWAKASRIQALDQAIGGPKAMAREGDYLLENDQIRLAILDARPSMGPHTSGGSLIDADLQRNDPRFSRGQGLDQLAEVFPTVNLNVQTADDTAGLVEIVNDGSNGEAAVICTVGPEQSFITLLDALWSLQWPGERPHFFMRTDYILEPGQAAVKMRTTAIFSDEANCDADLEAEVIQGNSDGLALIQLALDRERGGVVFGDFYLQGGSTDVFTPGVGFDEETYVNSLLQAGENTFEEPIVVDFLAGTANRVSYALMNDTGPLYVPMFTSSQTVAVGVGREGNGTSGRFPDGTPPLAYERWFGVGRGDVGSAMDAIWAAKGTAVGRINGYVVEHATNMPLSNVRVLVFRDGEDAPYTEWRTDVGIDSQLDGSFSGTLPPGRYEMLVHATGRPDSPRVPFSIQAKQEKTVVLESPRPGGVRFRVVDESGLALPAKVSFFPAGGEASPLNPVFGDGFIGGDPAGVVFTANGTGSIILPPGRYYAVASRGPEYELDRSEPFTLETNNYADLELQVVRSVDTQGWVSADFHVHAFRSHDSGVSLTDRAMTMAAEGVEFLASTDHDAITDYEPAILSLGIQHWLASTVGLEVTTIEVGHFLGFPLRIDHLKDQGGALDWFGLTPQQMIDGLRDLSVPGGEEPVVFVGHPRDGILGYFDQYEVNTYRDEAGKIAMDASLLTTLSGNTLLEPQNFSDDFDAIEVLNGKRFELIRTPTQPELDEFAETESPQQHRDYIVDMLSRTMAEQKDLKDGVYKLGLTRQGVLDDWFSLNNLGYRYTALGNSDTHGFTSIESGCPRNWVQSDTDDPAFLDEGAVARAVKEGRVVASFGPFIRFFAGEERFGPGSDVQALGGKVELNIEVQAPRWFNIDRVELYENGELIQEWTGEDINNDDVLRFLETVEVSPSKDSWYAVVALGADDLSPLYTPVEFPPIQLEDVVTSALAGVGLDSFLSAPVPFPRYFPVRPYAVTNPIWVDADGDGEFTPPGIPTWMKAQVAD